MTIKHRGFAYKGWKCRWDEDFRLWEATKPGRARQAVSDRECLKIAIRLAEGYK